MSLKHKKLSIPFIDLGRQYQENKSAIDARIHRVLDHGQYIMGPEVAELEERLASYVGVKHCIGVADGTTALMIAMMACNIGPGDEVITTPFTFIATGEMISILGATPVFVDIEPRTANLDPALIEAAITERTKAIIPVSLYGQCADMDPINALASHHGIAVIEDGAQSFGGTYKGRKSCGLSTIGTTSFFPSKPLGCYGDGGACFTNDDSLALAMRQIRVHGQSERYVHTRVGLNGRLDTIQAAVLLAKLDVFDNEIEQRQRLASDYVETIRAHSSLVSVTLPFIQDHCDSVFAQFTIRLSNREVVQKRLKERGVPTTVHYPISLHEQHLYKSGETAYRVVGSLENSVNASKEVVSLPFSPWMQPSVLASVAQELAHAVSA